jgi:lysophospholipase L1-like esterase
MKFTDGRLWHASEFLPKIQRALVACDVDRQRARLHLNQGVIGLESRDDHDGGRLVWRPLSVTHRESMAVKIEQLRDGGFVANDRLNWRFFMSAKFLALLAVAALWSAPARADDFFFKDGDTVVMIGDSITEQHLYSNYVEMWTVTRFPNWKLAFRNTGIGGDTSPGGNRRFERDVVRYRPTAITVDFGMNDGGYGGFNEGRFSSYMKGLQGMADQAKAAKIRVAWITPQPLDGGEPGKTALTAYNQTLEKFSDGVKEIAKKNDGLFVDQFHPYLAVLDKARAGSDKYERITAGDAVHPGFPGQALMAASILRGLNFPTLVAAVDIDVAAARATGKRCEVTGLAVKDGCVSFEQLDEALPFFPPEAAW